MQIPSPGVWGEPRDRDEVIRVLRRALELGVTFIDTADSYCSLNLISLSVERPILSWPPDSPSGATRLRDCPALQPSYPSTQDQSAGQHDQPVHHSVRRTGAGGRGNTDCAVVLPHGRHIRNRDRRGPSEVRVRRVGPGGGVLSSLKLLGGDG